MQQESSARPLGWLLAVASAALLSGPASALEEIRIGGTGNALGTMRLLGDAFVKQHPGFKVTVLPSIGTSGAMKAIPKGVLDIGLSARPLTEDERKLGAAEVEYARSPLVFAVATKSKPTAVTLAQVADIYSGRMANWPDGTPVRPIMRQSGNDETGLLRKLAPELDKALAIADQRPGLPFATTDQESADKTENISGAFGISTLGLIRSEKRQLRPLIVEGVAPTADNGASGKYPYFKRFFHVTRPEPSAGVKRFLAFVHSPAGLDILVRNGHWVP